MASDLLQTPVVIRLSLPLRREIKMQAVTKTGEDVEGRQAEGFEFVGSAVDWQRDDPEENRGWSWKYR